jgi:hypothetical protein
MSMAEIARKKFEEDNPITNNAAGTTSALNQIASRDAWRRMSTIGRDERESELNSRKPSKSGSVASGPPDLEEGMPIMAGYVNTGYCKGDRVKTTLRLPGACPTGRGWDPINPQTDEGVVVGPGNVTGEVMVLFDGGGHECSMKLGQITHAKPKLENLTHVERNVRRKSKCSSLARTTTL